MRIEDLGFDDWFAGRWKERAHPGRFPARVTALHRESCILLYEGGEIPGEAAGKLLYQAASPADLPTVGDWVSIEVFDGGGGAVIHDILPRRTLMQRKRPGRESELQVIAANLDLAFLIQSAGEDFNLRRLERYLVICRQSAIRPVFLLSKCDLLADEQIASRAGEVRRIEGETGIIPFSNVSGRGVGDVEKLLTRGVTAGLLGSSGVGKTSLLNRLIGTEVFATKEVREKDGKGRHATTRRELTVLERGGMVIDTPGMRELGTVGVAEGIEATFDDIGSHAANCRYGDCTHTGEPGCAVTEALAGGELSEERYRSYLKLRRESERNEMSLHERRQKDRQFGRMCKSVMKGKGRKS